MLGNWFQFLNNATVLTNYINVTFVQTMYLSIFYWLFQAVNVCSHNNGTFTVACMSCSKVFVAYNVATE